jgi:rhodanese-related sulfurtransferase
LKDEEGKDVAIFTGDTLFIGDVGRPDLAQKAANMTQEELAGLLYDSLRNRIMLLPDDIIVYPAHGAGSACGKNMSKETTDTLGHQKVTNYALRANMTREEFIHEVLEGLTPPPGYFPYNVMMNKQGYESIDEVMERGHTALSPDGFDAAANETDSLILDTRDSETFAKGFVPNSINIGIEGNFAPWVGTLIPDIKQPILLVTEDGKEEEAITRLARVGYDYAIGYLKGGFEAWKDAGKEVDTIESITVEELAERMKKGAINIVDVRRPAEFYTEFLPGADNIPLDYINENIGQLDKNIEYYVHCAGGYRSMIFISILKARGFEKLINIEGGFKAIKESGLFKTTNSFNPELI